MTREVEVAIVGGGLAGIAAALELQHAGREVLVLEASDRLGGKVGSIRSPHGVFPTGPVGFNAHHETLWRLLALLGLEERVVPFSPSASTRYIVRAGALRGIRPHPFSVLSTRALTWAEKLRLVRDFLAFRLPPRTEDESLDSFLSRRFGRSLVDHFFAAVLTGVFAGDLQKLSAETCLPALTNAEREYGSVLRGLLHALRKARGGPRRGLFTLPEGMGLIGERARERLPALLNTAVTSLTAANDRVELSGPSVEVVARRVVLATEAHVAARLLEASAPTAAAVLRTFAYAPLALAHWAEATPGSSRLPSGFGFLTAPAEQLFSLGTLFVGDLFGQTPRRFSTFVGGALWPERAALPDDQLARGIEGDLAKLTGGRLETWVAVQRWPRAVFQPAPGHARSLGILHEALGQSPIVLAGSYLGGAAMKDALASGFAAAQALVLER